jgi:DNA-binding transcriptional MerR regulator
LKAAQVKLSIKDENIPGSVLLKHDMGNVTGSDFLDKIFYISDGIMLSQIREITGIDGSTLQNWVKRGWVANTNNKRYSKDHLARILIINMLRGSMMLERIDFLLKYINGNVNDLDDDIISESQLYGYICDIIERLMCDNDDGDKLTAFIKKCTGGYTERIAGARNRLEKALEIIVIAYYASLIQAYSNRLYKQL